MIHKKEEGTCHYIEKTNEGNPVQASHLFDLCPGEGLPAPLTPDRD